MRDTLPDRGLGANAQSQGCGARGQFWVRAQSARLGMKYAYCTSTENEYEYSLLVPVGSTRYSTKERPQATSAWSSLDTDTCTEYEVRDYEHEFFVPSNASTVLPPLGDDYLAHLLVPVRLRLSPSTVVA